MYRAKVGDGVTNVNGLPFLADSDTHQAIKTLNTNNSSKLAVNSSEAIAGSGAISLHKVSKTGSYNDLNDKPNLGAYVQKSGDSLSGVLAGGAIDVHPENGGTIIGYYTNDLAFLTKRNGSYLVTNTTTNTVLSNSASGDSMTNMFDGSPSYASFTIPAKTDTVVIMIKSPTAYSWSTTAGIGFGASNWRAKNIKIEMGYSATNKGTAQSPDTDIVWATRANVTEYGKGLYYCSAGGPNTSEGGTSSATWSYMRLTLTNFNTTSPRIAQIFTVNYGSKGMHNTFLGLGGGTVYGDIKTTKHFYENNNRVAVVNDSSTTATVNQTGLVKSTKTGTTANRDYYIEVLTNGQMKVNVPWVDTDTNTTYSPGTGLSLVGTTFNHSNSITAQPTIGLYKIKYDAQGHISGASNVAKADITGLGIPGSDTNQTIKAGSVTFDANAGVDIVGGSHVSVTGDKSANQITISNI